MIHIEYIDTIKYEAGQPKALFLLSDEEKIKT